MAVSGDWQENLESILRESGNIFHSLRTLDFKNLNVKDVLTLVGLAFTGGKALYMGWQVYATVKNYGVARLTKTNLVEKYGEWAVVTGADHGIGEAYMIELASSGLNLIIIAMDSAKLKATAIYLEEKYKIKVHIADINFKDCSEVYDQIQNEIGDREVGILVNNLNMNYEFPQYFTDVPPEHLRMMIHGNVLGVTMATRLVLPQMAERGKGAIVIIGSSLSNMPAPQLAVYGATKAYIDYFSQTINMEYKDQGITVQTLLPMLVAGTHKNAMQTPNMLVPSASSYAHQAVSTLGWSDRTTGCLSHSIQSWITGFIPKPVLQWIMSALTSFIKKQAMDKLGLSEESVLPEATSSFFDTSFMAPQSLLGILGNSG